MTKLEYPLKNDILFKLYFVRYPKLLKKLVAELLHIREEELAKIEELGVPVMQEAIKAYRHVSASPEFRELERIRSKARHDEAQALKNAEERGEKRADIKWESIVADKDALIAELLAKLGQEES